MSDEPVPEEPCQQCGFDERLYGLGDTATSQWIVPPVLQAAVEGLTSDELEQPDADGVSIASRLALVEEQAIVTLTAICGALDLAVPATNGSAYDSLYDILTKLEDAKWELTVEHAGVDCSVMSLALDGLHVGLHALAAIGRQRVEMGRGAAQQSGSVHQINVSGGGVPKLPVQSVEIGPGGLVGDAQNDRRHHGRPVQAVCLWGTDVIAALAADGHPIAAGNAGENVTVAGIEWASLRPGSRITVGQVPMLITAHAIPCAKNAQWFSDRDFKRILHDRNPGLSRLYAVPLTTATVSAGDPVVVEG